MKGFSNPRERDFSRTRARICASLTGMSARRTARVQTPTGRRAEVGWYEGTSDAGIVQLFASALNIDTSAGIVARDPSDGSIVALNQFLPQGMLVEIDDTPNPAAASPPAAFRGQLLKFERIQAHLANERTWLAWVRTALSALSIAFSLLSLTDDTVKWLEVTLFVIGCLFVVNVLLTFVTGWLRYTRVKDVLMLSKRELTDNFQRLGVSHQARFLSALLVVLTLVYILFGRDLA